MGCDSTAGCGDAEVMALAGAFVGDEHVLVKEVGLMQRMVSFGQPFQS